jgi:hypothetical protein
MKKFLTSLAVAGLALGTLAACEEKKPDPVKDTKKAADTAAKPAVDATKDAAKEAPKPAGEAPKPAH